MLAKQQQFYIFVEVKQHVHNTSILVYILIKKHPFSYQLTQLFATRRLCPKYMNFHFLLI